MMIHDYLASFASHERTTAADTNFMDTISYTITSLPDFKNFSMKSVTISIISPLRNWPKAISQLSPLRTFPRPAIYQQIFSWDLFPSSIFSSCSQAYNPELESNPRLGYLRQGNFRLNQRLLNLSRFNFDKYIDLLSLTGEKLQMTRYETIVVVVFQAIIGQNSAHLYQNRFCHK